MWEVYLCLSELSFRYGVNNMIVQVQLTKRVGAVPIAVRDEGLDGRTAGRDGLPQRKLRLVAWKPTNGETAE